MSRDAAAERAAFEDAVRPLMPDLLAYFVRRVDPREDAADCLSETLLVLWRRRRAWPAAPSDRRAWAFGVAKKVLANHARGRMRRHALAEHLRAELGASAPPASDHDALLDALSPKDRELVRLIVLDGFGVAEAGALLGLRPTASRMRFARAKQRLRDQLGWISTGR